MEHRSTANHLVGKFAGKGVAILVGNDDFIAHYIVFVPIEGFVELNTNNGTLGELHCGVFFRCGRSHEWRFHIGRLSGKAKHIVAPFSAIIIAIKELVGLCIFCHSAVDGDGVVHIVHQLVGGNAQGVVVVPGKTYFAGIIDREGTFHRFAVHIARESKHHIFERAHRIGIGNTHAGNHCR